MSGNGMNGQTGGNRHGDAQVATRPEGHPSSYRTEYPGRLLEFFSGTRVERVVKRVRKVTSKDGAVATELEYEDKLTRFPLFEDFAQSVGVCSGTLFNWRKAHPEFLEAYTRARDMQKAWLIEGGLRGVMPAAAYIFTAKNVAGMRDDPTPQLSATIVFTVDPFREHRELIAGRNGGNGNATGSEEIDVDAQPELEE